MATVAELKKALDDAGVKYSDEKKGELEKMVAAIPAVEAPPEVPEKKGPDSTPIVINMQLTLQDGSVARQELSIVNPGGCIKKSQLGNTDRIFAMVKQGLINAYGVQHIKG